MFTWSELVNIYHLFLRDIYSLGTYSPEANSRTFSYLIKFSSTWKTQIIKLYERCATIYLYGSLDSDIWNSLKDFICVIDTIKIIEKMTSFVHFKDLEMNSL